MIASPQGASKKGLRRLLERCFRTLALASLTYVLGALVMYFALPSSDLLEKAFLGGRAWLERHQAAPLPDAPPGTIAVDVDRSDKTFDGFTLYTTLERAEACLVNMRGDPVHKWTAPFHRVWNKPPHIARPVDESRIGFFGCHLYPNGELLAVYQGNGDTPYGYGLVKLDKDSRVIWRYAAPVHHNVDVGPDGAIYALTQRIIHELPSGLEFILPPCLVDDVVVLSPAGETLKKIPVLEAFRDSPYFLLLTSALSGPLRRRPLEPVTLKTSDPLRDPLHTNNVMVLTPELAPKFPMFKQGQVLISVRNVDALAVLDIDTGKMVWAVQGPWRAHHAGQFLDNGHMLLYDNRGNWMGARVLEYDVQTQAFPWALDGEATRAPVAFELGTTQRLPNGNTLVLHTEFQSTLAEVTPAKELVWSCSFPLRTRVASAKRHGPGQVRFLEGRARARP